MYLKGDSNERRVTAESECDRETGFIAAPHEHNREKTMNLHTLSCTHAHLVSACTQCLLCFRDTEWARKTTQSFSVHSIAVSTAECSL